METLFSPYNVGGGLCNQVPCAIRGSLSEDNCTRHQSEDSRISLGIISWFFLLVRLFWSIYLPSLSYPVSDIWLFTQYQAQERQIVGHGFYGLVGVQVSLSIVCRVPSHARDQNMGVEAPGRGQCNLSTFNELCVVQDNGALLSVWGISKLFYVSGYHD